jgi:hypothetical protein
MLAEMIATSSALRAADFVIAGLDPAIHGAARLLDARVKPAHDDITMKI